MSHLPRAAILAAASILTSATAVANEFDFTLNDGVVSASFISPLGCKANGSVDYFYSDETGHLAQIGAAMTHDAGVHHVEIGGNLGYVWGTHSPNGSALSIGAKYALDLGSNLFFLADAYYTPKVLAFGNVEGHYQLSSAIQYDLSPQIGFFAGYRHIRFEYKHAPNETFDSGFFLGMKARF